MCIRDRYYNHDRERGVIGKWINLRKENSKLYGTPVFDEKQARPIEELIQAFEQIGTNGMNVACGCLLYTSRCV